MKDRETERDALFACGLEILLSTAMKSSIYVNHAINETWNQNPLIPSGKNNCFGHKDQFGYVSGKGAEDFEFECHYYNTSSIKNLNET